MSITHKLRAVKSLFENKKQQLYKITKIALIYKTAGVLLRRNVGVGSIISKFISVLRREGWNGLKRRWAFLYSQTKAKADGTGVIDHNARLNQLSKLSKIVKKHDTAVILHLYYLDMWDEIRAHLNNLEGNFDLFVSMPNGVKLSPADTQWFEKHTLYLYRCQNQGRDIAPFLDILSVTYPLQYSYVLKIHTKMSLHRQDGNVWRKDLYKKLLGSPETIRQIKKVMDSEDSIAMVAPQGHIQSSSLYWNHNRDKVKVLAARADIPYKDETFPFVAGTMFWFRPSVFQEIVNMGLDLSDFEPEQGQADGTTAHALERFFGLLVFYKRLRIVESDGEGYLSVRQIYG